MQVLCWLFLDPPPPPRFVTLILFFLYSVLYVAIRTGLQHSANLHFKGLAQEEVSLPPLGKVTREGVKPRLTQMERCWPWSGLRSLTVPDPSYTKRLVIAIISAAFALFSQMFYVVAAFHTESIPVLITYPQLSVFTALSQFNAIFFTCFTPATLELVLLS